MLNVRPGMYGCQASAGIRYLDSWPVSALRKVSSWRRRRRHGAGDGVGQCKSPGLPGPGKSLHPYRRKVKVANDPEKRSHLSGGGGAPPFTWSAIMNNHRLLNDSAQSASD